MHIHLIGDIISLYMPYLPRKLPGLAWCRPGTRQKTRHCLGKTGSRRTLLNTYSICIFYSVQQSVVVGADLLGDIPPSNVSAAVSIPLMRMAIPCQYAYFIFFPNNRNINKIFLEESTTFINIEIKMYMVWIHHNPLNSSVF